MADLSRSWLPLVLDEGQPAEAVGTVLRRGRRVGLLAKGGTIRRSAEGKVAASEIVWVAAADEAADVPLIEGARVRVTGAIHGDLLAADSIEHLEPTRPVSGVLSRESHPVRFRPVSVRTRDPAERRLMAAGTLLDIWQVGARHEGRYRALVTDVQKAWHVLSVLYGDRIDIVESLWSASTFHEIEAVLASANIVRSLGRDITPSGQMAVVATLLHLPSTVARRLRVLPEAAVSLECLVRPRTEVERSARRRGS